MTKHIHCCSNPDCDSLWECSGTPWGCEIKWRCPNCDMKALDAYYIANPHQPMLDLELVHTPTKQEHTHHETE